MRSPLAPLSVLLLLPAGLLALWPVSAEERTCVAGVVRAGPSPLPGAVVRWKGMHSHVVSDASGKFRLPVLPGADRLTGAKEGYIIGGADVTPGWLRLRLEPLPTEDKGDYAWVDPGRNPALPFACANCHAEIGREWKASGHARSATGKFLDLYAGKAPWSLLAEHPDGAGVCSSCHAPGVAAEDPAFFDLRKVRGVDRQGVHCDFCHKVAGPDTGPIGLTHGVFGMKLLRPREGQLFFGPLPDVDRGEDAFSPFYRTSRYCASCHEGTVFGVPVYTTYTEWQVSPAARQGVQCQDCHMAPTGKMTNIAPRKGGIERHPASLASHRFFAGSQAEMLRTCLKLTVDIRPAPGSVTVRVLLRAEGVGHRVPTGFSDRHLIVVAEGQTKEGTPLPPQEGPTLPPFAGPALVGQPGRVHAKLLRNGDGTGPVPFWKAVPEVRDNRLFPGRTEELRLAFPPDLHRIHVRVLHRGFWAEVARHKGWQPSEIVVIDRFVAVPES